MTLNEIELDVYRRLDYADNPPTAVKNRIDGFINMRHRQLLSNNRMRLLRLNTTTITTVANRGSYGLPYGCARIQRVMDQQNQITLGAQTAEWLRTVEPNPELSLGTPSVWVPFGFGAVAVRPVNAPALWIAALDKPPGQSLTIELRVVGQGGQYVTSNPTLSTPDPLVRNQVPLPSGLIVNDILDFTINKIVDTPIALFDAQVGGNLVSQISTGQTTARYYRIALYPRPSAPLLYWVDYEREIPVLVDPFDEPLVPLDFHDLIALLARLDEYEFKSDERWAITKTMVDQRVRELRSWVENHDVYRRTVIPSGPGRSRLGPAFPAGT